MSGYERLARKIAEGLPRRRQKPLWPFDRKGALARRRQEREGPG